MTNTNNRAIAGEVRGLIEQLRASDLDHRERKVDQIVTLLYPHFRNWAPTFCRVSGDIHGNHREDVVSIVSERVLNIVREAAESGKHDAVTNWYSYLYAASRYAALAYFNSSTVTAASGMTALLRKQRHIATTRAALRGTLGREPEDVEVIDAANTDMRARRSNPEKQGALVDLSDLNIILPTADIADHDRPQTAEEDTLLAPVEGRELVKLIVSTCMEVSVELGAAAGIWIGNSYSEPPRLGNSTDIARELGIPTTRASRLLTTVRDIAQDLCQRKFGISFPG